MPASARNTTPLDLAQRVQTIRDIFNSHAENSFVSRHLPALLRSLEQLHDALELHERLRLWTGKEPPLLGAVIEAVKQCHESLQRQQDTRLAFHSLRDRRDSKRASSGDRSSVDNEIIRLRGLIDHCALLVKTFNFLTVLKTAFTDTSRRFDRSVPRSTLHAAGRDVEQRELAEIADALARLWHRLRLISSQHEVISHDECRQPFSLEAQQHSLLSRLVTFVQLEASPIGMVQPFQLSECVSTEYERCVISIGALAIRREDDLCLEHRAFTHDCKVIIVMDKHDNRIAAKFQMAGSLCRWFNEDGSLVLEHIFSRPARERYPWKHAEQHGPLTVAFTKWQAHKSEIRCHQPHLSTHFDKVPEYHFVDTAGYELFQSCMREKAFYDEFETLSIKSKGSEKMHTTEQQYIKIWGSLLERADLTMTVPVTFADNQVRNQEIALRWLKFDRLGPKGAKITFNQPRRTSGASSSADIARPQPGRKQSFLRRNLAGLLKQSPAVPLPTGDDSQDRYAPAEWLQKFSSFTVEFKSNDKRDRFARLFETPVSAATIPSNTSERSFTPLPSPLSTVPTLNTPQPSTAATSIIETSVVISSPIDTVLSTNLDLPPLPEPLLHDFLKRDGPALPARIVNAASSSLQSPYKPLPKGERCIRLLKLDPGSDPDLSCSLESVRLDAAPRYEALSYCWGHNADTCTILAGDLNGFAISAHLWRALLRLRLRHKERLLWIDAICINQMDAVEKNDQIAMMRDIYAGALRTLIWLGDARPKEATCARIFKDEDNEDDEDDEEYTLCSLDDLSALEHDNVNQDLRRDLLLLQEQDDADGLADVWWKRVWCIQEFNFSRRRPSVFIGPHAIRWNHFWRLFDPKANPLELFHTLGSKELYTLFYLLSMTGSFGCADPRDRVFALLGMIDMRQDRPQLAADYRKSVVRVMEEACMFLIRECNTLDVLFDWRLSRDIWGTETIANTMPTWLADFTCLQRRDEVKGADSYNAGPGRPIASLNESTSARDLGNDKYDIPCTLQVRAVYFDRIVKRTTRDDIPEYQHSDDDCLIYNSLGERGHTVDKILNVLDYDFAAHRSVSQHKQLDPTPCLGRLLLDYVSASKRSIQQELTRRAAGPERDVVTSYERQEQEDLGYTRHEGSVADTAYVRKRWEGKIRRAAQGEQFTGLRMQAALDAAGSNRDNMEQDYLVARDLENLFAYARRSTKRYYLTGNNFEAPMRRDVLCCKDLAEVKRLRTQYDLQGRDLEFYEYHAKSRERDLFKTSAGFLGLGPSTLQVGDEIIVPFGCSRPWIIRKCPGLGQYFTLIGEVVVPSIMSGRWTTLERESAQDYRIK